jgi:hypothetical protein
MEHDDTSRDPAAELLTHAIVEAPEQFMMTTGLQEFAEKLLAPCRATAAVVGSNVHTLRQRGSNVSPACSQLCL